MNRSTSSIARMFCREVGHGGRIPRGWRMAWYEPRRRVGVYCPPPLHWAWRVLRELVHRMQVALRAPSIERAEVFEMQRVNRRREEMAEDFARGYMQGWDECFDTCLGVVAEEIVSSAAWEAGEMLLPSTQKSEPPN